MKENSELLEANIIIFDFFYVGRYISIVEACKGEADLNLSLMTTRMATC